MEPEAGNARSRGGRKPCESLVLPRDTDFGLPPSRTVRKQLSVFAKATKLVGFCSGGPGGQCTDHGREREWWVRWETPALHQLTSITQPLRGAGEAGGIGTTHRVRAQ